MEMNVGWLCTRCGKVNSPYVQSCVCETENKAAIKPDKKNEKTEKRYIALVSNYNSDNKYLMVGFDIKAKDEAEANRNAKLHFVRYLDKHNIKCGEITVQFVREIEE